MHSKVNSWGNPADVQSIQIISYCVINLKHSMSHSLYRFIYTYNLIGIIFKEDKPPETARNSDNLSRPTFYNWYINISVFSSVGSGGRGSHSPPPVFKSGGSSYLLAPPHFLTLETHDI